LQQLKAILESPELCSGLSLGSMQKDYLTLRRASAFRPSGEWNDDDFDVLADGVLVGLIFNAAASPVGTPWMWTLAFGTS
jgi:hypothetical protein